MTTDEEKNTTLTENQTIRYNLHIPVTGVTVKVCITGGSIHMYISALVPNPNSAFHDFFIELDYENSTANSTEMCGHAYVKPCNAIRSNRLRRQTSESNAKTQIVYISIEGRAKESSFVVNGTAGDIYHQETVVQNVNDFIATPAPTPPESKACKCVSHIMIL